MVTMRISQLAASSGVPASTLRYYEAEGLLPAERASNGYRRYDSSALERLAFINQAKQLDLPLVSVRELVTAWEAEPCATVRSKYRPLLVRRASEVRDRIATLTELHAQLAAAVTCLDALPDRHDSCNAACAFLDRDRPAVPITPTSTPASACALDPGAYADRVADWRALLSAAERVDVEDGARFTLPVAELDRAATLAVAEQECCSFYTFNFELRRAQFTLTITAPAEAADMLADLLPQRKATA